MARVLIAFALGLAVRARARTKAAEEQVRTAEREAVESREQLVKVVEPARQNVELTVASMMIGGSASFFGTALTAADESLGQELGIWACAMAYGGFVLLSRLPWFGRGTRFMATLWGLMGTAIVYVRFVM